MNNKFFKDLKKSLEEVVAYKKGKLDLYSEYIEISEQPTMIKNKHLGSDFDDLLREEGTLETAELTAIKMVIIDQVIKEMKKKKLSQTEMTKRLDISKATFMQLLDPQNFSLTLLTLYRIAAVLGKDLKIRFH